MAAYNIGFVIEHVLGHITHAKNLRQNVPADPDIRATWGLLHFETPGIGAYIPLYKSNWTVRAGLRARWAIKSMANERRLDALFFHSQAPAVLALDWIRRVPSIVSVDATPRQIDNLGRFYQHPEGAAWVERLKLWLNRECFRTARHVVAWSAWAKQGIVADYGVPEDKVTVVPPGVNLRDWMRPTPNRPHNDIVKILFVGGDLERKGGHLLINAFRSLRPLGVELHLVTRDKVPAEPGLFVYHHLQPNSTELKALYHSCDIFALPTFGDCLPMVLSEAGAAGMAVVATQLAAIPEIVREGETGMLVPVGDANALECMLRRLVLQRELRLHLGERMVTHIAREYDAQRNARRLLELLKSEVDRARRFPAAVG
jgi:glycosyltransferase involved in cell wall biosynthesis